MWRWLFVTGLERGWRRIYYHGYITEFDEEREGFWVRLDDNPKVEELLHYGDIEAVFDVDKLPFFDECLKSFYEHRPQSVY